MRFKRIPERRKGRGTWAVADQSKSLAVLCATLLAVLLTAPLALGLQPDRRLSQYSRRVWNTALGLPQNTVTALLQSSDGYLWIGTQGGLARFDGADFDLFGPSNTVFLTDPFITALADDDQGSLWIGTRQGLVRRDRSGFHQWTVESGLPHNYVRSLLHDSRGRIWVGTYGGGVVVKEPNGEGFRPLPGIASGLIRTLYQDRGGDVWIGSSEGLFRADGDALEVSRGPPGIESGFIRAIAEDANGRIWVGTEGGGLYQFDPDQQRFRQDQHLVGTSVRSLLGDPQGALWMGTESRGLIRFSGERSSFLSHSDGLPHESVLCLLEDQEGSLWVGTRAGLVQLVDGSVTAFTGHDGLASESVRAVYQDRQGRLWVGTEGGGPQVFQDGRFVSPPLPSAVAQARVRSLFQDSQGGLWLGTRRGLLEYREGRVRRYSGPSGRAGRQVLAGNVVNALAEHPSGTIWVGTGDGGVSRLSGTSVSTINRQSGLSSNRVRVLYVTSSGNVWVGTEAGLNCIRGSTITVYGPDEGLNNSFVLAIHESENGDLWLGTAGGGLSVFREGRFYHFAEASSALPATVFQILEDNQNGLWLSSPQGIFQVHLDDLNGWIEQGHHVPVERFTEADGMLTSECTGGSQPAGWKTADGRLWFPSLRGVAMIDPDNRKPDRPSPQPLIERVTADFRETRIDPRGLRLSPGIDTLEFFFTAPSFVAPSRIRFRYRMEGLRRNWIEVGKRRVALFTNLAPGTYRFQVSASQNGRDWSDPPIGLDVVLEPYFYQTGWFQLLIGLATIAGVAGLVGLRLRASESRRRALQQLVAEQTEQLQKANVALRRLASVDDLTGLTNHRGFQEELRNEWRRAARAGRPLTLIMIDIDFFKPYNDRYGHLAGDACLKAVAHSLALRVRREGEVLARYGGEEFVALLPELSLREGLSLAEEMRQSIEALGIPHEGSVAAAVVTVSAGVASTVPDSGRPPSWLFEAADSALYHAKQSGRNHVVAFSPRDQQ